MFCLGCQGGLCEPDPRADQPSHGISGIPHITEGDEGYLSQHIPPKKVPRVPLLLRMAKEKGHSGYTLLLDGPGCIGEHIPLQMETWTFKKGGGLGQTNDVYTYLLDVVHGSFQEFSYGAGCW